MITILGFHFPDSVVVVFLFGMVVGGIVRGRLG
jgi:hypothetical protein